jgi:hypothetical protein
MSAATSGIEFDALMLPWIALRLSGLRLAKLGREKTRRENEPPHPEALGTFCAEPRRMGSAMLGPSSFEARSRSRLRMRR